MGRRGRVDVVKLADHAAVWAMSVLVTVAASWSFAESYRGLYLWAAHHGVPGLWAAAWPLQVDVFIAVGELALFVALARGWPTRARVVPWIVTGTGLAVSVAGNVGHATSNAIASRLTWAVPPVAAAAALFVGMLVFKWVMQTRLGRPGTALALRTAEDDAAEAYRTSLAGGNALSVRQLAGQFGIGRRAAGRVVERVGSEAGAPSTNGHRAQR